MIKNYIFHTIGAIAIIAISNPICGYSNFNFMQTRSLFNTNPLVMGTIQYPHSLKKIPLPRIYCGGDKIKCEANNEGKNLTFAFNTTSNQNDFYLLIIESRPQPVVENGVILYQEITKNSHYKIYNIKKILSQDSFDNPVYRWKMNEVELDQTGHIPDGALIICINPEYIQELKIDSQYSANSAACKLPTIVIRQDLLEFVGSEKLLHELSDKLRLAALDSDAYHSWREKIKISADAKTVMALTT